MIIYSERKELKWSLIEWLITLLINSCILMMCSKIFKGFYIESFAYAIITSLVIILLNLTVKPFLKLLTLPITIMTVGMFYPFVNVMILKLTGWIMNEHFSIDGIIVPFFISIFISIMSIILDSLITKRIVGAK